MAEIATASRKQSTGLTQIGKVTQSNAASAEESAAEELYAQAAALKGAVERLQSIAGTDKTAGSSSTVDPSQVKATKVKINGQVMSKSARNFSNPKPVTAGNHRVITPADKATELPLEEAAFRDF